MTDEQVNGFHSDFKYVADYFVQMQRTGTYIGSPEDMCHVREVLYLMTALTGDGRFASVAGTKIGEDGKGEVKISAIFFPPFVVWVPKSAPGFCAFSYDMNLSSAIYKDNKFCLYGRLSRILGMAVNCVYCKKQVWPVYDSYDETLRL